MSKPISILLGADWCRHCQNWPCLLSWSHLHIPYHHSNSIFFFLSSSLSESRGLEDVELRRAAEGTDEWSCDGFVFAKKEIHSSAKRCKKFKKWNNYE